MAPTIQDRKLQIIEKLTVLNDEHIIRLIENLLFEETEIQDDTTLSEDEKRLIQERVADYHKNPNDEIPWANLKSSLKRRDELRP